MKVLMFGWENNPERNAGLGVACEGILRALKKNKVDVTMVSPSVVKTSKSITTDVVSEIETEPVIEKSVRTHFSTETTYYSIRANIFPYQAVDLAYMRSDKAFVQPKSLEHTFLETPDYSKSLSVKYVVKQVEEYGLACADLIRNQDFDIIYAHDWMSFKAALMAKAILEIPFIAHVHSTEYDRSVFSPVQEIIDIEKDTLKNADHIVAVSAVIADKLTDAYAIDRKDVTVIPNAPSIGLKVNEKTSEKKYLSFIGRLEYQKGPGYFLDMAFELQKTQPKLRYLIVGDGSLSENLKQRVEGSVLDGKVEFLGMVSKRKITRLLDETILLYHPAISEPYGLAAMEAIRRGVPAIVTEDTGMVETVTSVIKVQYWNLFENLKIIQSLLANKSRLRRYSKQCYNEAKSKVLVKDVGQKLVDTFSLFV